MPSDVAVYNPSPVMANNKEAVQQLERDRGDGEKVQGRDRFAMIVKKSQPALGQFWVSGLSSAKSIAEYEMHEFRCKMLPCSSFKLRRDCSTPALCASLSVHVPLPSRPLA